MARGEGDDRGKGRGKQRNVNRGLVGTDNGRVVTVGWGDGVGKSNGDNCN